MNVKIPIFYAFARSGGTLVNRCLGSIPGNVVLSEVNPYCSVIEAEQQAKDWFSLMSETEYQAVCHESYAGKINYIATKARLAAQKLIVRDWVTVNFLADCLGDNLLTPSQVLEQEVYLSHYGFEILPVVICRHSADVYESLVRTFAQFRTLPINEFGSAYFEYTKAVCRYPIFHYEDICQNPEKFIEKICHILEINYNPSFLKNFKNFMTCTGDNKLPQASRGSKLREISLLDSNKTSKSYIAAMQNEYCRQADILLNYDY